MDRTSLLKTLENFRDGKIVSLRIPNPVWRSDTKDLLNFKIQPNFTLGEFLVSITKRIGAGASQANSPEVILQYRLVDRIQYLRDHIAKKYPNFTISITSGLRTSWVDRAVGGSGRGPHTRGWAVDVTFGGISIPGWSADKIRRGVAYEAMKLGIRGIELIADNRSVHLDPVRSDWWITKQVWSGGRPVYPNINPRTELAPHELPLFKNK